MHESQAERVRLTEYERYAWASAALLLVIAVAIFFGLFLSLPFGFLALALAAGSAYSGWQLRRLYRGGGRADDRAKESEAERSPTKTWRMSWSRILVLSFLCSAILIPAILAGLPMPLVVVLYLGFLAVVTVIEFRRIRRWYAKKPLAGR
jgi:hypothetical protein